MLPLPRDSIHMAGMSACVWIKTRGSAIMLLFKSYISHQNGLTVANTEIEEIKARNMCKIFSLKKVVTRENWDQLSVYFSIS